MRLPVSWLRDFVATDATAETIADVLTQRGLAVDAIHPQPTPERIVVGKVESLARHPQADRLLVAAVDVGGERLQIVTGATNVAEGNKVPIALPGAVVFERAASGARDGAAARRPTRQIAPTVLRGVESRGMMCSPDELALPGDYDDGIFIMDDEAPVGAPFWQAARFGDAVLEVDVPSNRADCLSVIGVAREVAAGLQAPFSPPTPGPGTGDRPCPVRVEIEDPDICRRLLGQCFFGLAGRRSPTWMVLRLAAAGMRSLNFAVDVSNFVQLETGQPLHFYDLAALRGGAIVARAAREGETVVTLDGVERRLDPGTPVIADGAGPVGLAGIMGGAASGVTATTRDIFVESPNFVGPRIRRASLALGLRTEGALRHEKDLPLELPEVGRRRAAQLLMAAGAVPSQVVDAGERPGPQRRVQLRARRVNAVLGTSYAVTQMKDTLRALAFEPAGEDDLEVGVPYWRRDVREEVDLIEEIARGIGYDTIPEARIVAQPQRIDESLYDQESILVRAFAALGYHEIVSLPLQGSKTVAAWERSGLPFWPSRVEIVNPLSEDHRFLRPSLLPALLATAATWYGRRGDGVRLFEVGHIFRRLDDAPQVEHRPEAGVFADNGVVEWPSLAGMCVVEEEPQNGAPGAGGAGDGTADGAAGANTRSDGSFDRRLLELKGELESVLHDMGLTELSAQPRERTYFHPGASGNIKTASATVAKFGRLHPRLARAFELPETTYAFSLLLENIPRHKPVKRFVPLPRFPATRRDIAVVVDESLPAGSLTDTIRHAGIPHLESVRAFDEYRGPQVGSGKKSIALTMVLRRADGTLTDEEANATVRAVVTLLQERFAAALREAT